MAAGNLKRPTYGEAGGAWHQSGPSKCQRHWKDWQESGSMLGWVRNKAVVRDTLPCQFHHDLSQRSQSCVASRDACSGLQVRCLPHRFSMIMLHLGYIVVQGREGNAVWTSNVHGYESSPHWATGTPRTVTTFTTLCLFTDHTLSSWHCLTTIYTRNSQHNQRYTFH